MNEEVIELKGIDEIPMFSWNTKTKEFYVLGHKFDGVNSIEDFINYINNLEQENQQLEDKVKWYEKENTHNQEIIIKLQSTLEEIRKFILSFDYYIPEDDKNDLLQIIDKGVKSEKGN